MTAADRRYLVLALLVALTFAALFWRAEVELTRALSAPAPTPTPYEEVA